MKIEIIRTPVPKKPTMGEMHIDGKFFCYTLEDEDRGLTQDMAAEQVKEIKVYGKTAIPTGTYKVILTMSMKFKRELPLVLDVPGFEGIRIHRGNWEKDTLGCPLVGYQQEKFAVGLSRKAEEDLILKFRKSTVNENTLIIKHKE